MTVESYWSPLGSASELSANSMLPCTALRHIFGAEVFVEFIKVIQFTGMWGRLYAFQYFQCKYKVWQGIHHLIRLFVGVTYFPVVGWQQRGQFAIFKK